MPGIVPKVRKLDESTIQYHCACGKFFAEITVSEDGKVTQETFKKGEPDAPPQEPASTPEPKPRGFFDKKK